MRSDSTQHLPKLLALEINAQIEAIERFCYQQMIPLQDSQLSRLHETVTRFYRTYAAKEFVSHQQFYDLLASYVCHYILRLTSVVNYELESKLSDMLARSSLQ